MRLGQLVFVAGLTVMAVEMAGLRLLAPFFGTSLLVTTLLIGSMMAFLALGYTLGGRHGDHHPSLRALGMVTGLAAVWVLLIPAIASPLLTASAALVRPLLGGPSIDETRIALAMITGGLLGVLALFSVPVTLLGMVSPWAVRLAVTSVERSGRTAGRLYALSTTGSILGSFLPVLVLLPLLGVRRTFLAVGGLLLLSSLLAASQGPSPSTHPSLASPTP